MIIAISKRIVLTSSSLLRSHNVVANINNYFLKLKNKTFGNIYDFMRKQHTCLYIVF